MSEDTNKGIPYPFSKGYLQKDRPVSGMKGGGGGGPNRNKIICLQIDEPITNGAHNQTPPSGDKAKMRIEDENLFKLTEELICKPLESSQSKNFLKYPKFLLATSRWPKSLRTLGTRLNFGEHEAQFETVPVSGSYPASLPGVMRGVPIVTVVSWKNLNTCKSNFTDSPNFFLEAVSDLLFL